MGIENKKYNELTNSQNKKVLLFYQNYAKKLLSYTRKNYTINEDDAWTIVYKTIYKMAEVSDGYTFENEHKQSGFVFKTHINFLRNYFRDNKSFETNNREVELHDNFTNNELNTMPTKNTPLTLLQNELQKLDDWQRILLLMRGQNIEYSKIAEFVNKPENQLKVYYARLKKQLHQSLNHQLHLLNTPQNA